MNGLKLEPGWRHAWVAWLNLLAPKSKPPASASNAPLDGSSATSEAAVAVAPVVLEHPMAQALGGGLLVLAPDGGVDPQAAHVRGLAVLLEDRRARHLRDVVGLEREHLARIGIEPQRLGQRLAVLL